MQAVRHSSEAGALVQFLVARIEAFTSYMITFRVLYSEARQILYMYRILCIYLSCSLFIVFKNVYILFVFLFSLPLSVFIALFIAMWCCPQRHHFLWDNNVFLSSYIGAIVSQPLLPSILAYISQRMDKLNKISAQSCIMIHF